MLVLLNLGDVDTVAKLFTGDATALSDGAGEFFTAGVPIIGARRVARFLYKTWRLALSARRWCAQRA